MREGEGGHPIPHQHHPKWAFTNRVSKSVRINVYPVENSED